MNKMTPNEARSLALHSDGDALLKYLRGYGVNDIIDHIADREDNRTDPTGVRCVVLTARGLNQLEVSRLIGVSREAVRQQLARLPEGSTLALKKAHADKTDAKKLIRDWSLNNVGTDLIPTASAIGITPQRAAAILGDRAILHPPAANNTQSLGSGVTPEEHLTNLRRFHTETGSTVSKHYDDWAKKQGVPGRQTVMRHFDKWNDALTAAGITPTDDRSTVGYKRTITRDRAIDTLVEALTTIGYPGSATRIDAWLREQPQHPSLASIRKHGRFADLRHEAITRIANTTTKP